MTEDRELAGGRYVLTQKLGTGGTADVFEAHDRSLNRDVAVKLLHRQITEDPSLMGRFNQEVALARSLDHPGIVTLYKVDNADHHTFMVLELMRGGDLRKRLLLDGALQPQEARPLLEALLDALGHAHQRGIVHRDIKPRNILYTESAVPKLSDFGLAQSTFALTAANELSVAGTPEYTAPESITAGLYDARTDLYALGATLYEALTGFPPYRGNSPPEVLRSHVESPAPVLPQTVHNSAPDLAKLIEHMLAKDPNERPQTCREAVMMLERGTGLAVAPPARQARCMHCGAGIDADYPWCFTCHRPTLPALAHRKNGVAVVVTGPGRPADQLRPAQRDSIVEVTRAYGLLPNTVGKALPRIPFVLIRNMERASARRLAADLRSRGLEVTLTGRGLEDRRTFRHALRKAITMTPRYYAVLAGMGGLLVNVIINVPLPVMFGLLASLLIGTPAVATLGFSRAQSKWPKDTQQTGTLEQFLLEVSSPLVHARVQAIQRASAALLDAAADDPLLSEDDKDALKDWLDRVVREAAELGRELHRVREGKRYAASASLPAIAGQLRADQSQDKAVATSRELDLLEHRVLERLGADALYIREIAVRAAAGGVATLQTATSELEEMVTRLSDERRAWEEMELPGGR